MIVNGPIVVVVVTVIGRARGGRGNGICRRDGSRQGQWGRTLLLGRQKGSRGFKDEEFHFYFFWQGNIRIVLVWLVCKNVRQEEPVIKILTR